MQTSLNQKLETEELESGVNTCLNDKIVYDCIDPSPFYTDEKEPYMYETQYVDLGPTEEESKLQQEPQEQKKASKKESKLNQPTAPPQTTPRKINRYYTSLKPFYVKKDPKDTTLIFESRFESGNLRRASKHPTEPNSYNLILKYDYDTTTYTQWFYFRVSNVRKGTKYKFTIVNLVKPDSSYNLG